MFNLILNFIHIIACRYNCNLMKSNQDSEKLSNVMRWQSQWAAEPDLEHRSAWSACALNHCPNTHSAHHMPEWHTIVHYLSYHMRSFLSWPPTYLFRVIVHCSLLYVLHSSKMESLPFPTFVSLTKLFVPRPALLNKSQNIILISVKWLCLVWKQWVPPSILIIVLLVWHLSPHY